MKAAALALAALGVVTQGCSDGCTVGDTWCEGDLIMVCEADYSEDEDDWGDEEQTCGFFCSLLELIDEASNDDTYEAIRRDCSEVAKTCVEATDDGDPFCDYAQAPVDW